MPNIKPVSDLRNYAEVLKSISSGSPVYLTKNGRGRYVIQEMGDYERKENFKNFSAYFVSLRLCVRYFRIIWV